MIRRFSRDDVHIVSTIACICKSEIPPTSSDGMESSAFASLRFRPTSSDGMVVSNYGLLLDRDSVLLPSDGMVVD